MARHNKKRNVGLIYELLVRRLSQAIVEHDKKTVTTVKQIINARFKKGTQLHKEFRLFNAIAATNGVPDQIAYRILDEAKKASLNHDPKALDIEKSRLIKDINHRLNESNFYDTKIDNYAAFASAQQLFNCWRSGKQNIAEIAKHESTVHAWLTSDKKMQDVSELKTEKVNDITVKIMQEKFEKKYTSELNPEQTRLLHLFFEGKNGELLSYMQNIHEQVEKEISKNNKSLSGDRFLLEKVGRINNRLGTPSTCDINEVSKSMVLAQLLTELRELHNVKG